MLRNLNEGRLAGSCMTNAERIESPEYPNMQGSRPETAPDRRGLGEMLQLLPQRIRMDGGPSS